MKRMVSGLIVGLAVLGVAAPGAAQTISAGLLEDWQRMRQLMTSTAEAMPEETFDFAPTPEQRNFGEQILHVAGGNVFLMGFLGADVPAPTIRRGDFRTFGHTATAKSEILQILSESFDYGEAVLKEFDDAGLQEGASGPPFINDPTRLRVGYFAVGHLWDIYGQMVVYLRLNDVVPPASRRGI